MKCIWKIKRKFEISVAGKNLFLTVFEEEEDLELILKGRSWLFRKHLIVFERLSAPIERSKIRLQLSPFWIKIGSCPQKCEKKDLMHAIGMMFGGLLRSEVKGDFCRIKVQLNA